MADEQDEWLDAEAAEALLRGEWAGPGGPHDLTGARQLDAALRAVRTPRPSAGELPGEDALLAAFGEAAGAARRRDGATRATGPAGRPDTLRTVRIDPTRPAASSSRRLRWSRPVRYGLAVSLAGCALGGVAAAGGTGILPVPFGDSVSPVPASSVSAAASPRELGAEAPDADPSARPSGSAGEVGRSAEPEGPDAGAREDGGTDAEGDPPDDGGDRSEGGTVPGPGTPHATDGPDGRGGTDGSAGATDPSSQGSGDPSARGHKKSLRVCRDYRDDSLSGEDRRRLVELARGERNVERFCDRLLDRPGGGRGDTGPGSGPGEDGGRPGSGDGGGDADTERGTGGGDGPRPSSVSRTVGPARGPAGSPGGPVTGGPAGGPAGRPAAEPEMPPAAPTRSAPAVSTL
ncbi:hypothetical protein OG909_20420 [Streptomyces sp. NBC_01754]|uniref:hypothetical protein n=1 Tax=Streptomyces sp. NBC_01754 TaxID=2975930 RepID=UPI002DD86B15|nr:hypothetical protein [Streptomyces sp. NBC_01754]WSC94446.1 hypothetical protein OG909_20420 [Streptomyces sp. NBC_01754]